MGRGRFKKVAVVAVALIASACEFAGPMPEPAAATPMVRALSVYVEPPDVVAKTADCRNAAVSGDVSNLLRGAVQVEFEAAGMTVVKREGDHHDIEATTHLVLNDCGHAQRGWRAEWGMTLHDRGLIVWQPSKAGTFLQWTRYEATTPIMRQVVTWVAARLVRDGVRSEELLNYAKLRHAAVPTPPAMASAIRATPFVEAPADSARADALFKEGRQMVKAGQLPQACDKFGASYDLDPVSGTLMNLADCEERVGRLTGAWMHWRQLLRALPQTGDERREHAQRRVDELEPRLARLTIRVGPKTPSGARILLDDFPLADSSVGHALLVGLGEHTVSVEAGGRVLRTYPLALHEGEKREAMVEAGDAVPDAGASATAPGASATPPPPRVPAPEATPVRP